MASIEYVLRAVDGASGTFYKVGVAADSLNKQLKALSDRVAKPSVDLEDKAFQLGIAEVAVKLNRLSARAAKPKAELDTALLQRDILRANAELDKLEDRRVELSVEIGSVKPTLDAMKAVQNARSLRQEVARFMFEGSGGSFSRASGFRDLLSEFWKNGISIAGGGGGGGGGRFAAFGQGLARLFGQLGTSGGGAGQLGGGLLGGLGLFETAGGLSALISALIPTVLGGAVGSVGLYGASAVRPGAFSALMKQLQYTFYGALGQNQANGGGAFLKGPGGITGQGPAGNPQTFLSGVLGILKQVQAFIPTLGPGLQNLFKASLPYLQMFVKAGEQAAKIMLPAMTEVLRKMQPFLPAIGQGLVTIVKGFAGFLNALGPTGMQAGAKVFVGLARVIETILIGLGHTINGLAWAFGKQGPFWQAATWLGGATVALIKYMVDHWAGFQHETAVIFDGMRHEIAHIWDIIYNNSIGAVIRIVTDVHKWVANMRHDTASVFDSIRHDIAAAWDWIWRSTLAAVGKGVMAVVNFFKGLPGKVVSALLGLGTKLWNLGKTWLTDLWNGIKSVWNSVLHFFSSIPSDILHALGIHSPPDWAISAGKHIMEGLHLGMAGTLGKVLGIGGTLGSLLSQGLGAIGHLFHGGIPAAGVSGGVALLGKAMAAARGWTGTQWDALNAVAMAESGWSMTATNKNSGAYGIAQFINGPSEYYSYGGNPNTAAGQITGFLNYISRRYGDPVRAWLHEEQFHWYGAGLRNGVFNRPTLIGVGERGPERVNIEPLGGSRGGGTPMVTLTQNGNVYLREPQDATRVAKKISFAITASGFG